MNPIVYESYKDIELLKAIARAGIMTEDFLPYFGISVNRLKQHVISENIIKRGSFLLYGRSTNIYVLSNKSKRRLASEFMINTYKSDVSQLEHDYCLLKTYTFLTADNRNTWITESKLKVDYPYAYKTCDGLFLTASKKRIGVEVITDSYSKRDVESKKEFIRKYCDGYIMLHTHKKVEYKL